MYTWSRSTYHCFVKATTLVKQLKRYIQSFGSHRYRPPVLSCRQRPTCPIVRVKFGPLGWNVTYNFGDSDLDTAFKLLGRFVDDLHADASTPSLTALPVESLVYVTGNITYGGWVTDEWDRRCLLAVLDHFYSASIFGDTVSMFCR